MVNKKIRYTVTLETSYESEVYLQRALLKIEGDILETGAIRYFDANGNLLCRVKLVSLERRKR